MRVKELKNHHSFEVDYEYIGERERFFREDNLLASEVQMVGRERKGQGDLT